MQPGDREKVREMIKRKYNPEGWSMNKPGPWSAERLARLICDVIEELGKPDDATRG